MNPSVLQHIKIGTEEFKLLVPEPEAVTITYVVPSDVYWKRLWPAATALSQFLLLYPHYIIQKKVLELGAGLGLPSLVASRYAYSVCCSDKNPDAVQMVQQTIDYNRLDNIKAVVYDWLDLPNLLETEVILLSDINYNPEDFTSLQYLLIRFLQKGSTIILSTPHRLIARSFFENLMPWCIHQEVIEVSKVDGAVFISVFVLKWKKK